MIMDHHHHHHQERKDGEKNQEITLALLEREAEAATTTIQPAAEIKIIHNHKNNKSQRKSTHWTKYPK